MVARWPRPAGLLVFALIVGPVRAKAQEPEPPPSVPAAPAEPQVNAPNADGRRTTTKFVVNLGRNVIGVFSRGSLKPLIVGAALTGASTAFDDNVEGYFGPKRRAKWLGDAVDVEGQPQVLGPIGLALYGAGRLSHSQRFRDATYDIGQAMLVSALYSTALKSATHRHRPNSSNRLSFPSGHTSDAFAWATAATHYYGLKLAVPAYFVAGLIGVGRLENNAHHLSDVVAGATLGVIVGLSVVRKDAEAARSPRVSLAPARDAYGAGAGLTLCVEF